jgi:hypothetical protein
MLWTSKTLQITTAYWCDEGQCIGDPYKTCHDTRDRNLDINAIRLTTTVTFEAKILREMYSAVQECGEWRIRNNHELYQLHRSADVFVTFKAARLRWAVHLQCGQ